MTRSHACLSVPLHQTNNGDAHTANLFGDSKKKTPNRFPVLRYNMLQLHAAQRGGKKRQKQNRKRGTTFWDIEMEKKDRATLRGRRDRSTGKKTNENQRKQNKTIDWLCCDEITRTNGEGDTRKFCFEILFIWNFLSIGKYRSNRKKKKPVVRKKKRIKDRSSTTHTQRPRSFRGQWRLYRSNHFHLKALERNERLAHFFLTEKGGGDNSWLGTTTTELLYTRHSFLSLMYATCAYKESRYLPLFPLFRVSSSGVISSR